jgi:hypothetical protein
MPDMIAVKYRGAVVSQCNRGTKFPTKTGCARTVTRATGIDHPSNIAVVENNARK